VIQGERGFACLAVFAALTACAPSKSPGNAPSPRLADPEVEAHVSAVLETIVVGDTRQGGTDSLFVPGADIISNGSNRVSAPRLAGVHFGGQAAVTTSQVNVRQDVAWATIDYRWFSEDKKQVHLGKATLVLAPGRGGSWKVVQLHSSSSR
jgi:hypothetical protein